MAEEFTQEELDALEAYLFQGNSGNNPGNLNESEDDEIDRELDKFLHDIDAKTPPIEPLVAGHVQYQESHPAWDPEAVYYDLQGNVIYEPPKHLQSDLSDLFGSNMSFDSASESSIYDTHGSINAPHGISDSGYTSQWPHPTPHLAYYAPSFQGSMPLCRYYPNCKYGNACRYRHPSAM
jgi:hypothetical protein